MPNLVKCYFLVFVVLLLCYFSALSIIMYKVPSNINLGGARSNVAMSLLRISADLRDKPAVIAVNPWMGG